MLKIFNCHSFETNILDQYLQNPQIYVPIGGGGFKNDYVRISDDIGENISKYNKNFNDFTVTYWVGKHIDQFEDTQYVGFGQYRRMMYLSSDILSKLRPDVIMVPIKDILPISIYDQYKRDHVISDMDQFIDKFNERFPELKNDFNEFLSQNVINWLNMFIMHRSKFIEFFKFIEPCIEICINDLYPSSNINSRNNYQVRGYAFLLERVVAFWYYYQNKYKKSFLTELPVIVYNNIKSPYQIR